MEATVCWKI